jgi:hypothetical protein
VQDTSVPERLLCGMSVVLDARVGSTGDHVHFTSGPLPQRRRCSGAFSTINGVLRPHWPSLRARRPRLTVWPHSYQLSIGFGDSRHDSMSRTPRDAGLMATLPCSSRASRFCRCYRSLEAVWKPQHVRRYARTICPAEPRHA